MSARATVVARLPPAQKLNPMFLNDEQLIELTGYVQPAAQIRWLRRNGLAHYVRADGHPKVAISTLQVSSPVLQKTSLEPDLEAVRGKH